MPTPKRPTAPADFGVYVHLPFCRHQCAYCTFYTLPNPASADPHRRLIAAVQREWQRRVAPRLARGDAIRTVYIGGGTPSESPADALESLLGSFDGACPGGLRSLEEVTVECNPESASAGLLERLRDAGVDRVSLGVQALHDADLETLDRGCTVAVTRAALQHVAARFERWNADLILGIPGSSWARVRTALEELADAGAPHLSFYCLELPAELARRLGDPADARSDDAKADQYEMASTWAEEHGYEHYEISNAARPGQRAAHNSAYWTGRDYIGLGPGAHSLEAGVRRANRADLNRYLQALESDQEPPAHWENLTPQMIRYERILLGLRRCEGLDWQEEGLEHYLDLFGRLESSGLARLGGNRLRLTARGWLVSDSIVLQLVTAIDGAPPRVDKHPATWLH